MAFPGKNYASPGVYTQTLFENPLASALDALKVPVLIGEGNESLIQNSLEIVRGSSATVDQRVVSEDEAGRAVFSVSAAGDVTRVDFNGVLDTFQVKNFPIVSGDGTGTTTNTRTDVSVTVNGTPVVVRTVTGATGLIKLAQAPAATDVVRCTYYFDRSDTLITDDLSAQVPNRTAFIKASSGLLSGETIDLYGDVTVNDIVTVPANNVLNLMVDGTQHVVTIPPNSAYTMASLALALNAESVGTLVASTFVNNLGQTCLQLGATSSIAVLEGSANAPLFLVTGQADNRTTTFYVFNGPIVDGSGGGITTTDPSDVTVKVANRQVIPVSVDGATRAVTLAVAPAAGATVTVQYYFNSWQDTFDYLAHIGVTEVTGCGSTPSGTDYIQDTDFVLQSDTIMWGTAARADAGTTTTGSDIFGSSQVGLTLVDSRNFMGACEPVVLSSGGIASESRTVFTLPVQPTLGNGRDTPLGQSLYQTISNSRIDLPVDRPDVVWAYWGWGVQDALTRGRVTVLKVEGLTMTLETAIPVGASVYATTYYNLIQDQTVTLTCVTPGISSVGTYTVQNAEGEDVFRAYLEGKGSSFTGVTVEFPGGSELRPDFRFESGSGDSFTGPANNETVTVTFRDRQPGPARYTFPGSAPYSPALGLSDNLRLVVHGNEVPASGAGIDLANPSAISGNASLAHLTGSEIVYTGGAGATVGQSFTLTAAEEFALLIDDATLNVTLPVATNVDATWIATFINETIGHKGAAQAGGTVNNVILEAAKVTDVPDDYYIGYKIVAGHTAGAGDPVGGEVKTITAYDAGTQTVTVDTAWSNAFSVGQSYYIYNPDSRSSIHGETMFDGNVTFDATHFDELKFVYVGATTGTTGTLMAQLTPAVYATPALLAAHVQTQIAAAVSTFTGGSPAHLGLDIEVTANVSGQLVFKLQLPGLDATGYMQFVTGTTAVVDFCVLAGLPHGTSGTTTAALIQGPVARAYECPAAIGTPKPYDRIILRNRILPPGNSQSHLFPKVAEQGRIEVLTGSTTAGLVAGAYGTNGAATIAPARVVFSTGFSEGQNATTFWPVITFYDGTGTLPANDTLYLTVAGVPVTVSFTSTPTGTATAFGPVGTAGTVAFQIEAALTAAAAGEFTLAQTGTTITVASVPAAAYWQGSVVVGTGSANASLGLTSGSTFNTSTVTAEDLVSALMSHANTTFATWLTGFTFSANCFANYGLAAVQTDSAGAKFLYVQDAPAIVASLGTASSIVVNDAPATNALAYGTGFNAEDGDGDIGDPLITGFTVTSTDPAGSGSIGTSILNDGVGQDGIIGQTYRDEVTGLTFTVLPRGWSADPVGPWLAYPTGTNANFRIGVNTLFTANANVPTLSVPGVELTVSNTSNVAATDTATVTTFKRSGNEPAIGDLYYASYVYSKQDYDTAFFTKMSAVEAAFGSAIPDNPVSLATYLAMINGAVLVGVKQVVKASGEQQASLTTYRNAIEELEGVLPGEVQPDIIVPLRGDSIDLYQILKRSNDKMSSQRYRSERTSILGVAAGTIPRDAMNWAQALGNTRERLLYPDMATILIQDNVGNQKEYLIDGTFIAAAMTGSVVSPNVDVATPWTGRRLVGFTQLARTLDMVEMNQIASKGLTILENKAPFLRVRHGLTTDMTNVLTKLPTIVQIADEVQRQSRQVLDAFIGIKFLPGVLSQIEGRLAMMLKQMVASQIITAYTGVKASVSQDDPTVAEVEAYYSPVFPLLYIVLTFHLRSSL